MRTVTRQEVQKLLSEGGQVVEVLPNHEYAYEHIAGAVNIPLKQLDGRALEELDPTRPVIVYCQDFL